MTQNETPYLTGSAEGGMSGRGIASALLNITQHPVYGLWLIALAYLIPLTLAEITTTFSEPWVGLALHGLILLVLLLHSSLWARNPLRRFLLALALAPLIRLLSLSLPLPSFPFIYWYMVVGVPLFLAAFAAARVGRVNGKMMGITGRGLLLQFLVAFTGVGLGYIEYLILRPDPLIPELRLYQIFMPALILLIFTGLLEEIIFRGLMQYAAIRVYGRSGLFYVAGIFAVLHIGYRSILDLIFVFIVALYFAWITHRSGSIFGVTLAHGVTNIALYLILPFILEVQVKVPVQKPPQQPGLLAPIATQQSTRQWLPLTRTLHPPDSPTLEWAITLEITATPAITVFPTQIPCPIPSGWLPYIARRGDTLASLGRAYAVSKQELRLANCLVSNEIAVGQKLYVPYLSPTQVWPTATIRLFSTIQPSPQPTQPVYPSKTPLPATITPALPTLPPEFTCTPLLPTVSLTHTALPPTAPSQPTATELSPTSTPQPPTVPSPNPTQTEPPIIPPTLISTIIAPTQPTQSIGLSAAPTDILIPSNPASYY